MADIRHYNVHDLISFRIARPHDRGLMGPINLEFSFFETPHLSQEPDIHLNISQFTPMRGDDHLIDHKYYVRPNYFCCSDASGRAKWDLEIKGFEEGYTTVNFWGQSLGKEALLYPDLLPQDLILKPLLEYKLCKQGPLLIHAAALCKEGKAYLLVGRGSSHKTTLAMQLVQRYGFQLMGDDQVIIQGKTVLCFPKHIAQLSFKLDHMQTEEYGIFDKLRIIGYLRQGQFNLKIPRSASLAAVVFASRTNQDRLAVTEIPEAVAIKKLALNNMMDMNSLGVMSDLFLRYMQAYSYLFPRSSVAHHWDRLSRGLYAAISGVPLFEMQIPQTCTPHVVDALEHLLQESW